MCQWKFFVFRYRANTSARMAFMPPAISAEALAPRSVGVTSGAARRAFSSFFFASFMAMTIPQRLGVGGIGLGLEVPIVALIDSPAPTLPQPAQHPRAAPLPGRGSGSRPRGPRWAGTAGIPAPRDSPAPAAIAAA